MKLIKRELGAYIITLPWTNKISNNKRDEHNVEYKR